MRAILDSNVLISGLIGRGPPYRILRKVFAGLLDIALTRETYEEFRGVLLESPKFQGISREMRGAYVAAVAEAARFVVPSETVRILDDDADNRFLEAAAAFHAEYIVSGDKPLLNLERFRESKIVTPREFLRVVRECGIDE